jgi:type II secretory ATPase GspE/PulE/Tfp pilus assembly ATPase PilB-like protein
MTEAMRELTIHKASSAKLLSQATRDGMVTLRQAGVTKVLEGTTSLEEILRVTERDFTL